MPDFIDEDYFYMEHALMLAEKARLEAAQHVNEEELIFSTLAAYNKYMNPETLTADNIFVTRNGELADGTVELLNEEVAYEGQTQTYASKVRFTVPETEISAITTLVTLPRAR